MKTVHDGANAERKTILAKVRRLDKTMPSVGITALIKWIQGRVKRNRARNGGL